MYYIIPPPHAHGHTFVLFPLSWPRTSAADVGVERASEGVRVWWGYRALSLADEGNDESGLLLYSK